MTIPKKIREAAETSVPQDVLEDLKKLPVQTADCWQLHEVIQLLDNEPEELQPMDYLKRILHLLNCRRCPGVVPEVGLLVAQLKK